MVFKLATIEVTDLERSLAFYNGILGVPLVSRAKSPNGFELAFLGEEGQPQLELISKGRQVPESRNAGYSLGFEVEDAKAIILKAGGEIEGSIKIGPGSKIFFVSDPDGYKVELLETKRF
jgi:lactoylglutathione lyase